MSNKNKRAFCLAIITISTVIFITGVILADQYDKTIIGVISTVIFVSGICTAVIIDYSIGQYECKYCQNRFSPSFLEYLFAPHIFSKRKLKCPKCGEKGYCKRKIDFNE